MTCTSPITRLSGAEAAIFTHTPVSRAFAGMLTALSTAIDAETDLTHGGDPFDPALADWLRAAEDGWERVREATSGILDARPERAEDAPLQVTAFLFHLALGLEDREDSSALGEMLDAHGPVFRSRTGTPAARRVNSMIAAAMAQYRRLDALIFESIAPSDQDHPDAPPAVAAF